MTPCVAYIIDNVAVDELRQGTEVIMEKMDRVKCGAVANLSKRNPYYPIDLSSSAQLAIDILVGEHVHRLAVVSGNELRYVLTQSHLVRFLHANVADIGSWVDKTVGELGLGMKDVVSVESWRPTRDAFRLMNLKKVSGVAVVDRDRRLKGNLSASDFRMIDYVSGVLCGCAC